MARFRLVVDDSLNGDKDNPDPKPSTIRLALRSLSREIDDEEAGRSQEIESLRSDLRAVKQLLITTSVGFLGSLVAFVMVLIQS